MQKLLSKLRQAINDFKLIEDGDKIAVGLSGGKDSLVLLNLLKAYQKFSPESFELIAITLNPGGIDNSPLHKLCKEIEVPFYEIQTNIKEIVFDIKKEKNPCPADGQTKRQSSKELIKSLNKKIPGFRDNLFKALTNSEQLFIWDKEKIINGDI